MVFGWFWNDFHEFGSVSGSETEQNTSSKNSYFSKLWVPLGVDFSKKLWNIWVYFGNRQKEAQEEHEHNLNITRVPIVGQWGDGTGLASAASERSDRRRRQTDGQRTDRGLTVGRILGIRTELRKVKNDSSMDFNFEGKASNVFHDAEKINALPVPC